MFRIRVIAEINLSESSFIVSFKTGIGYYNAGRETGMRPMYNVCFFRRKNMNIFTNTIGSGLSTLNRSSVEHFLLDSCTVLDKFQDMCVCKSFIRQRRHDKGGGRVSTDVLRVT